jgi:ABC-type polysaccharide/polyol phosphate transport system ATPase subunit
MNHDPLISLEQVSKKYKLYTSHSDRLSDTFNPFQKGKHNEFFAIRDLNLSVNKGDIIGIMGKNGSGKSTLLKLVAGIAIPTSGFVKVKGQVVALLELGTGFHPHLTGRENIYFYTTLLGYKKKEIQALYDEIVNFADIGAYIDQPLKKYSSGMKSRLAFSVSVLIDPDILIVDEVLAVGDESFKNKSKKKMTELFKSGKTILFVSHSMIDIKEVCNRAIMLEKGIKVMEGNPNEVAAYYLEFTKE